NFTQLFYVEGREGWVFWGSGAVFCRRFWGRSRGADGRFCREIPGFLGGERVRRGDSAHGGHGWANWAKNFLKIFNKRGGKPKIGVWEVVQGHLI
ncbi:hypothetical protein, partial [Rothia mucilaginosa]